MAMTHPASKRCAQNSDHVPCVQMQRAPFQGPAVVQGTIEVVGPSRWRACPDQPGMRQVVPGAAATTQDSATTTTVRFVCECARNQSSAELPNAESISLVQARLFLLSPRFVCCAVDFKQPRYYCRGCQKYWTHGGTICTWAVGWKRVRHKKRQGIKRDANARADAPGACECERKRSSLPNTQAHAQVAVRCWRLRWLCDCDCHC